MDTLTKYYNKINNKIIEDNLFKDERIITTPQSIEIKTIEQKSVLNFCSNNYLGLSNDERVVNAAKQALSDYGFGLSSVRFICGTQDLHKNLEHKISNFLIPRTPYFTPPALMQMVVYLKLYWDLMMQSSQTP